MALLKNFFSKYEFRRKTVHFVLGILFVIFINLDHYLLKEQLELILCVTLILALCLSIYTRYKRPLLILRFLYLFDKPKDLRKFPGKGAVYYLIGVLISIALFDRNVASASILILAVGDPMAHIISRYYGKRKIIINNKKLLEGTLAGTLFGTIAASFFVPWDIAFFGAAFGMMAEAVELELFNLDDNFFIPFVSGLVMTVIKSLL